MKHEEVIQTLNKLEEEITDTVSLILEDTDITREQIEWYYSQEAQPTIADRLEQLRQDAKDFEGSCYI